jgi:sec-independent protein translocase protein TatA
VIGGLGVQELIIVLVIALFVFGGKRLPEVGQSLGKAIRGFKEGSEGKEEEEKAIDDEAVSKKEAEEPAKEEQTTETSASETTETPASEEMKEPEARNQEEKT